MQCRKHRAVCLRQHGFLVPFTHVRVRPSKNSNCNATKFNLTQCLYIRPAVCIASVSLCIRPDLVWYFTYLSNYYTTDSGWRTKMATDFCRAMLCISAARAVMRCLSVRLSVTFVDHVKTNKHIVKIFSPSGSHTILVFPYQTGWR